MMPEFALQRPRSLGEAVDLLAAGGTPYCGGTELLAVMRLGLAEPETLVDLKRVPELVGIEDTEGEVTIRARTTHDDATTSPLVRRYAAVLAAATAQLGNSRVRATGTLVGNICFAEPRSDVLTALLALDATVDLRSADGVRSVRVEDFVEGAFTTTREEPELVEAIRVPKHDRPGTYVRFQPAEYPTVTVAVTERAAVTKRAPVTEGAGGGGWRVTVGAVGDRPAVIDVDDLADVDPAAIAEQVDVIEDLGGREDYKRHLTQVFVGRAVGALRESRASA